MSPHPPTLPDPVLAERERTRVFMLEWGQKAREVTQLNRVLRRKNRQIQQLKATISQLKGRP